MVSEILRVLILLNFKTPSQLPKRRGRPRRMKSGIPLPRSFFRAAFRAIAGQRADPCRQEG